MQVKVCREVLEKRLLGCRVIQVSEGKKQNRKDPKTEVFKTYQTHTQKGLWPQTIMGYYRRRKRSGPTGDTGETLGA